MMKELTTMFPRHLICVLTITALFTANAPARTIYVSQGPQTASAREAATFATLLDHRGSYLVQTPPEDGDRPQGSTEGPAEVDVPLSAAGSSAPAGDRIDVMARLHALAGPELHVNFDSLIASLPDDAPGTP